MLDDVVCLKKSQNKVIAILLLKGSLHTEDRGTNYLYSFSLNHLFIVVKSLTLFHLHRKPKMILG